VRDFFAHEMDRKNVVASDFKPAASIYKISTKASKKLDREKRLRKIDKSMYDSHKNKEFGIQRFRELELANMMVRPSEDGELP